MADRSDIPHITDEILSPEEQERIGIWTPLTYFQRLFELNQDQYSGETPAADFFNDHSFTLTRSSTDPSYVVTNFFAVDIKNPEIKSLRIPNRDATQVLFPQDTLEYFRGFPEPRHVSAISPKEIIEDHLQAVLIKPLCVFQGQNKLPYIGFRVVQAKNNPPHNSSTEETDADGIQFIGEVKEGPAYPGGIRRTSVRALQSAKPMGVEVKKEKKEGERTGETLTYSQSSLEDGPYFNNFTFDFVAYLQDLCLWIEKIDKNAWQFSGWSFSSSHGDPNLIITDINISDLELKAHAYIPENLRPRVSFLAESLPPEVTRKDHSLTYVEIRNMLLGKKVVPVFVDERLAFVVVPKQKDAK